MPTIDKRFLLKLLLVLFASTGVLFAAHAVQARRIPVALKLQSERAAEAGKSDLAIHYLRQYLEFYPDDAPVLKELAELLARRAPTQRGRSELLFLYDRILRIDPDQHEVRRKALDISLPMGRFSDAVTYAEALLNEFPSEAVLWRQLGAARAGLNELEAARQAYEKAIALAPTEMLDYQLLAQLLWRTLNDAAGARDVLDRMVKALPQEPEAYLIRARFETYTAAEPGVQNAAGGDLKRAALDLQRVFELDPENAEAALLLAEIMQRNRNIPAAHALLRDAVSLYPRDQKLVRALSWLELIRGNAAAAITVLEDALRATPDGLDLMVPLADLLVEQGDTTRTADLLRRLEDRRAPATQVKYLKARMAMRAGQWAEAVEMIESLRAEIVNLPGLKVQLNLLLAACFQQLGDPAAEEEAFERAANDDPKNVSARVGFGTLCLNLGRFEDAANQLKSAVESPYATGAVVAQWVRLRARMLLHAPASGGWSELERELARYAPRFGRGSSEPVILLAELLALEGRADEAVRALRRETATRPGDARLWAVLAVTAADLWGAAAGLAVIDEAQAASGDCADVRLARAALSAREPGRVRPIDGLAAGAESWPENEQLRLLAGLVEVYEQLGDRAKVVQTLKKLVARQPASVALWSRLHECAVPGDPTAATLARAALVRLEGEAGPSVLLCDARAATGAEAAAVAARVSAALGASPNRADACLALARLKRLSGDEPAAVPLTERAFLLEPTKYEAAEALLEHLARTGATDRVAQLLARFTTDPRWAGDPFRRMIGHVLTALPAPAATAVFDQCRPLAEREPGGSGWIAECAVLLKRPDAPALLDAAIERPGATADDWLRKALVVSKADPAAGPEVLRAAKAKLTPVAYANLVAVYADSAAGSTFVPEAGTPVEKRVLAQARLAVKLSRSRHAEAGKVLEEFLAVKGTPPADVDWARRNLAMIYAVGGTQEDRVRAMALLKDVATGAGATPEELRQTVSVLATLARYLEGPDRRAVLQKAQKALDGVYKATNAPADLWALAQLYRAAGDRPNFRLCLQALLDRKGNDAARPDPSRAFYLTAALEELLDEGNLKAAETFAKELRGSGANDFKSLAALARLECQAGRPERGLAVAEDYARLAESTAGDYLMRSAQVAELLDELSRLPTVRGTKEGHQMTDATVERFSALVPNRPEAIVGVAGALAADGRADEAFTRVDRLGRYLPARLRASAGLAIVRNGPVTERQAEQVRECIDACLKEDPDSVTLLLNRAEFLARRGDGGAVAAFETVLEREPKNVVALNNLAWLLAADTRTAERALDLVARATREGGLTGELLDTRARVQITLKQFAAADLDLREAISHDPTALRWFHIALLRLNQTPPAPTEAAEAFAKAKRRGLDPRGIHPADLPTYRVLEAAPGK